MKNLVLKLAAGVLFLAAAGPARPVSESEAAAVAGLFVSAVYGPNGPGSSWQYEDVRGGPGAFVCERVLGNGASVSVMVGAATELPPVLMYYRGRPREERNRERMLRAAAQALGARSVRQAASVYYSPFDLWFEYEAGGRSVMISVRDLGVCNPAAVRDAEPVSYPPAAAFPAQWQRYLAGEAPAVTDEEYRITGVPDYDWHYGCAPTAAANVLAYWDRRGYPLLVDSVNYNVYDPVEHDYDSVPNVSGQLARAMNTGSDGGTRVDSIAPGILAVCNSPEYGNGYSFTSQLAWDDIGLMIGEIRADRPGVLGLIGHPRYGDHAVTYCGYGPPDTSYIMIHDAWSSTPEDTVVFYYYTADPLRRCVFPVVPSGGFERDAALTALVRPEAVFAPGTLEPQVVVRNRGSATEPCSVVCAISRPGGGFYERFDGAGLPPGWTERHPPPDAGVYNWHVDETEEFVECRREASMGNNNDWLISPRVRVRERDTLCFWYRSLGTGAYHDSVEVWVSYTDAEPGSFRDCIQAFDFNNTTMQPGWADFHTVGDTMVHIAFRYGMRSGLAGTGVALDDIRLKTVYYLDTVEVALAPGESRPVSFAAWNVAEGHYACRCSVYQQGDENPANDVRALDFVVSRTLIPPSDWRELTPMPAEPSGAPVRDGGSLTCMTGRGLIFALKGGRTRDFYSYDPGSGTWLLLPPVEPGDSEKPVKKGGRLAADDGRYVYLVKGNNTLEFWRYDADTLGGWRWEPLESVPAGPRRKKVRGGTDLVHVPATYGKPSCLYLLKGYGTEFYRYNILTGQWQTLDSAPAIVKAKYRDGSFLVYDGDRTIYCHQAQYYYKDSIPNRHALFRYDIVGDTWHTRALRGMPLAGRYSGRIRSKKSKDGGSGTWFGGALYALKGGNTGQFFRYAPDSAAWRELDTIPTVGTWGKRRVKNGADIAAVGNAFYALKGNKTRELWRYAVPVTNNASRNELYAGGAQTQAQASRMSFAPNPIASGFATLRIQGFKDSRIQAGSVRVFDAAGRCVLIRSFDVRSSSFGLPLDLRALSGGIYLVRLDTEGRSATQKLVVQK